MRRWLVFAAALVALAACDRVETDPGGALVRRVSDPMPVLDGEGLDGSPLSSADAAGQVLVVNVWATWCAPCEAEQPALVRVADRYADRGVTFLGVNHQDQLAAANAWIRRYDVPYPSLYDPAGRTAAKLGYLGLPDTYIVDPSGTIRVAVNGGVTEAQLTGLLDEVLAASGSTATPTSGASPTS